MRIVSLLPATTEWIFAFGAGDQLVGRSHACDRPPEVRSVPEVTWSNVENTADSRAIDEEVGERLSAGLSLYELRTDLLAELAPDVVLAQDQCEACAVSRAEVADHLDRLAERSVRLVNYAPSTLKDVFDEALRVARSIGRLEEGMHRLARGERRLARLAERLGRMRADADPTGRPTVCCVEWMDPLMVAGQWMPDVVEQAGGRPLLVEEAGEPSRRVSWGEIREADPDVLALMPCGFDLDRVRANLSYLRERPGWSDLRAVRDERVVAFDGSRFFNRPGPSLYRAVELLARVLHPGRVAGGTEPASPEESARIPNVRARQAGS